MKAMILAAGLGTRLRPLTDHKSKALVPIANKPVIDRVIAYLKGFGIHDIVINAHHHYGQLLDHLDGGRPFGVNIDVRVEHRILGTGGGIKNTEDFWGDEPFVVINADILTDIDLNRAFEYHKYSDALATLVVHDCEPFNQIKIDKSRNVTEIGRKHRSGRLAFTGIHIISPDMLAWIPDQTFSDIITCYQTLIDSRRTVKAYITDHHYWCDIGSLEAYFKANRDFLDSTVSVAPNCDIDPSVKLLDWAVLGERTILEKDVEVKRSILWDGVIVKKDVRIIDSVITSDRKVVRDVINDIY